MKDHLNYKALGIAFTLSFNMTDAYYQDVVNPEKIFSEAYLINCLLLSQPKYEICLHIVCFEDDLMVH